MNRYWSIIGNGIEDLAGGMNMAKMNDAARAAAP